MSEDYPEPPTTAEAEFPLLSEAEDPEEYRDKWGQVIDDMVSRRLEDYLTGNREIPAAMVNELESTTHSTEEVTNNPNFPDGLSISGVQSDIHWEIVHDSSGNTSTLLDNEPLDFDEYSVYEVSWSYSTDTGRDLSLEINNSGSYEYRDSDDVDHTDEDNILVFEDDSSATTRATGIFWLTCPSFTSRIFFIGRAAHDIRHTHALWGTIRRDDDPTEVLFESNGSVEMHIEMRAGKREREVF